MSNPSFRDRVESLVSNIPSGKVMSYGEIAALVGNPRAARVVGGIAHYSNPSLPWHRVVNKNGGLATGYPGGKLGHQTVMEGEGFEVVDFKIDIERYKWFPKKHQ